MKTNNIKGKIWLSIAENNYVEYDALVDLIKNTLAPNDNEKAYIIEDKINEYMAKMFDELEKEF